MNLGGPLGAGPGQLYLLANGPGAGLVSGHGTGADTQPQICRISITRRLGRGQIEPEGAAYPPGT